MASEVTVVFEGTAKFDEALGHSVERALAAARNIVSKGAIIIADEARKHFRGRPAGSQRTSSITGRTYWQGAPQYPAEPPDPTMRSGLLRRSIRPQRVYGSRFGWASDTGPSQFYGGYVEFGTSRSRAFPYLETGLKNSSDKIEALAESEWTIAVEAV